MSDEIKHQCGIALIRLLKPMTYYVDKYKTPLYGLNKLYILMEKQHNRGHDGAGIGVISFDIPPGKDYIYRRRSLDANPISDIFTHIFQDFDKFNSVYPLTDMEHFKQNLPYIGELLMGHLRYGTHGENTIEHCHPFLRKNNWKTRNLMIAGNFNMTNNDELFNVLVELGQFPPKMTDTITTLEKIGHFLDSENEYLYQKFKEKGLTKKEITKYIEEELSLEYILNKAANDFDGGYVIAGMIGHGDAFVLRDPAGIRPAYYYQDEEILVVASEKPAIRTAFNLPDAPIQEINPGYALIIKKNGNVIQKSMVPKLEKKSCSFERIYFSRGTDEDIYRERKSLGKYLTGPVLESINYDLDNTVFSFIPNTAEIAFLGLVEGLEKYLNECKKEELLKLKTFNNKEVEKILSKKLRIEKIAIKDAKIRTFITGDKQRKDLVTHVYDTTYGVIRKDIDNLVIVDDSIIRGTTLKESVISILDRLHPKKIIIVSSAPQIRYPDCYGIDMSKLMDFVAFKATIELLKESNKDYIIKDVYGKCKSQEGYDAAQTVNYVREIYSPFTAEEISQKIIDLVKPDNLKAELDIIYQSIEDLHRSIPDHKGDWYFTGNFPTPGGNKVVNRSFINFYEGRDQRAY